MNDWHLDSWLVRDRVTAALASADRRRLASASRDPRGALRLRLRLSVEISFGPERHALAPATPAPPVLSEAGRGA